MLYIHPFEFGEMVPDVRGISAYRRFRHFVNIKKCRERYSYLFQTFRFGRAVDILGDLGLLV